MTPTERLLEELIALPSVNPAFSRKDPAHAGERQAAEFLASVAAQAGLDVEFQEVLPHRPNVLAFLSASGTIRRRILLVPHLDTVDVEDESQWKPHRKGRRLYGRGACDTKGSAAAMLAALCHLARNRGCPPNTEIMFAGVVDEENAQAGSRALAARSPKPHLAIVGEPTRLQVVTTHKGNLWLRLKTRGRAAHGSRPDLGQNAIHLMAQVVDALETKYAATLRKRRHPLLGCPTLSVGTIQGGTQPNIVPDTCVSSVDRRTVPGETEQGVRRDMAAFLAKHGLEVTISSEKNAPCPPLETSHHLPLVRSFMNCAGQTSPAGVDFFCDAAVLAKRGIPSVVFGPGNIAQAHTRDEWISLDSLQKAGDILIRFFKSFA